MNLCICYGHGFCLGLFCISSYSIVAKDIYQPVYVCPSIVMKPRLSCDVVISCHHFLLPFPGSLMLCVHLRFITLYFLKPLGSLSAFVLILVALILNRGCVFLVKTRKRATCDQGTSLLSCLNRAEALVELRMLRLIG